MAYQLKEITIRTNNSVEGMLNIAQLWQDVLSGKLPLLTDSDHKEQQKVLPITKYSNYHSDESGDYDLSILVPQSTNRGVTTDFFADMDKKVAAGVYKKYFESGEDLGVCTKSAWEKVWHEQKTGIISRAFTEDYEITVPDTRTQDGKAHCYLYIAIKE